MNNSQIYHETIGETPKFILRYAAIHGTKYYLNLLLIWIYVFNAVFIPYDDFMLKKVSYILLVVFNIGEIINGCRLNKENIFITLFGGILPIYTIIKSAIITHDFAGNFASGYTGMIILLFFVIRKSKIDFISIMNSCLTALAVLICFSAFFDAIGLLPVLSNPILKWMYETSNANIGSGSIYLLGYYIFVKTSPMLLVGLGYQIQNRKYISTALYFVVLVLSGTRANASLAILVLGIGLMAKERTVKRKYIMLFIVICLGFILLIGMSGADKYIKFSSTKVASDMVREETLPSIIKTWQADPLSFIVGQGYTGEFYNYGIKRFASDVELSYWNLLRRVGVICFFLMMVCYLYPIWKIRKDKNTHTIITGYVAYLVGCYVNPLLYTSTGVTVLLYMFCISCLCSYKDIRQQAN